MISIEILNIMVQPNNELMRTESRKEVDIYIYIYIHCAPGDTSESNEQDTGGCDHTDYHSRHRQEAEETDFTEGEKIPIE